MSLWVSVQGFGSDEYLEADILNRPVRQLRERTDYLYRRLEELSADASLSSLRLIDVPLATNTDYVPQVKDIVYYNPETKVYEQALATIDVAKSMLLETDYAGYAVGMLIAKSSSGATGTIVISGKANLSDVSDWALADLMEPGETFRSGPYFLSAVQRGKLSSYPNGPEIYIGYFSDNVATPGIGGYALINPQYRSFAEAHIHQSFPLKMQPVGTGERVGETDLFTVHGFRSVAAVQSSHGTHDAATGPTLDLGGSPLNTFVVNNLIGLPITNVTRAATGIISANTETTVTAILEDNLGDPIDWQSGDEFYIGDRHRLVVTGGYTASDSIQYDLILVTDVLGVPSSLANTYLSWTSSDPEQPGGLVRVPAYEYPVSIGTKGLQVALHRVSGSDWTTVDSSTDAERRQWSFIAREETEGWLDNEQTELLSQQVDTDNKFRLFAVREAGTFGDPVHRQVNVQCSPIYKIAYSDVPVDGDTLTIGGIVFEFDDDVAPGTVTGTNIRVGITPADAPATYRELQSAILDAEVPHVTPVMHETGDALLLLYDGPISNITSSLTNAAVTTPGTTYGATTTLADAYFAVYDANYESLVLASNGHIAIGGDFAVTQLAYGITLRHIPMDPVTGETATSSNVHSGDRWSATLTNEAPGAAFRYSLSMNHGLSAFFPPIPLKSASLVVNGIELASEEHFPDDPAYKTGFRGFYWYSGSAFPWPTDWLPGETGFTDEKQAVLHLIRPRAGATGLVRSLTAAPDSPVSVTQCGTDIPASVGDLQVDVDLSLRARNDNLKGYHVFKQVQGTRLLAGPVVSRILPGPGYRVISPPGVPSGFGDVQLQLDNQYTSGEFQEIALQNAKHEMIGLFPYIRLLGWTTGGNNVPSGFTAKFNLPAQLSGLYRFSVSMTIFGEAAIASGRQNAGLTFEYSVLHDYKPDGGYKRNLLTGLITPAVNPITWEIPIGEDELAYTAYDPMIVHTAPDQAEDDPAKEYRASEGPYPVANDLLGNVAEPEINNLAVRAGSQIAIRIQRGDIQTGTEYTGALGIMNLRWRLLPVSGVSEALSIFAGENVEVINGNIYATKIMLRSNSGRYHELTGLTAGGATTITIDQSGEYKP